MNKRAYLLPFAAGLALVVTGCTTPGGSHEAPPPASQADINYLREEIRRLNARFDAAQADLGQLHSQLAADRAGRPDTASAAQVQTLQGQLEDLQRQLRAIDAARVQDKKEIYDDISAKVAKLIKASARSSGGTTTRAATRSDTQTGWEHVVQSGETLSQIAAAYKVRMSVIADANGMKSIDSPIYAGQKLFIPD